MDKAIIAPARSVGRRARSLIEQARGIGEGVRATAAQERVPREQNASFLNRALRFNPDFACATVSTLLDELLGNRRVYRRDKWQQDLSVLLGNLLWAHLSKPERPIAISRNANDWHSPARYGHTRYQTIELSNTLHARGYIGMKKGNERISRMTRIWAEPELLDAHPELPHGVHVTPPAELVELRDSATKKLLDYTDTDFTNDCRRRLEALNEVNQSAEITYYDDGFERHEMRSYVRAIFLDDFTLYGRLHTSGARHAQGLTKAERGTTLINGSKVVELDFSGLHLHILYAEKGIQYCGDPYMDVLDHVPGLNAKRLDPYSRRKLRRYLKIILLTMLNASDTVQGESAANYWKFKHRGELVGLKLGRARPYIRAFHRAHRRIGDYFHSGNGLRLMNRDAGMALDVVEHFSEAGIPIIPIHDGFIVQWKHEQELRQVMRDTYRRHNHGFRCPIRALHQTKNPILGTPKTA